jgi:hypothetical protein
MHLLVPLLTVIRRSERVDMPAYIGAVYYERLTVGVILSGDR